jgi:small-conductance mechanosensitive channel/CRP-like cAMP-binding protein
MGSLPRRFFAAMSTLALVLAPLAALAEGAPAAAPALAPAAAPERVYYLTSRLSALVVAIAVVAVAFLVNRFAASKRRDIRRTVILALLYLGAFAAFQALRFFHLDGPAQVARDVSELLGVLCVVSLVALALLDLGFSVIGVEVAAIVTDLAVGLGYIVATLVSMARAGFDFSGILATSALLTTITAFSLQGTLSNVVGGVALQLDDSIKVGDWVQLENGKQGRVREIRWRYTVIETRDWDTMIVPNATLLSATILILGKREGKPIQHRMWIYFNVDFRYSPVDVIAAVQSALTASPIEGVAADPPPNVVCLDFAKDHRDSFAYYAVRYWLTDLARDDPTSSRVRERIYTALKRACIPLAVPAAHLWIEQDDAAARERKDRRESERRKKALSAVEFLKPLTPAELDAVAERLRFAPFAPGEPITKQGAVAHWLYILVDGTAVVQVSVDGAEKEVARLEAPTFFGEMGLMTGAPRTATVVALSEVECYRLDKDAFHRILTDRPEIAEEISTLLASRKIGLEAVKEDLDAAAHARRIGDESVKMLQTIRRFFGLGDEDRPPALSGK